jgi:hypothetical protein
VGCGAKPQITPAELNTLQIPVFVDTRPPAVIYSDEISRWIRRGKDAGLG